MLTAQHAMLTEQRILLDLNEALRAKLTAQRNAAHTLLADILATKESLFTDMRKIGVEPDLAEIVLNDRIRALLGMPATHTGVREFVPPSTAMMGGTA